MKHLMVSGARTALVTEVEALDLIETRLRDGDRDRPMGVASINLDHVHHFGTHGAWADSLGHSVEWLNLIDGAPIASEARRVTGSAWPRLAGSDLIGPILDRAEAMGIRVGFLGGSEETRQLLLAALRRERPALVVAGAWSPPRSQLIDPMKAGKLAQEVREHNVELLVVGLGKPRQELWIEEHGQHTGARVLLAFGAVVDFIAGRVARAPEWVVSRGMEWAWRLALEPRRLARRYLVQGPPAYIEVRRSRLTIGDAPGRRAPGSRESRSTSSPPGTGSFVTSDRPAEVCVVVVTYNSADDVTKLLLSLREHATEVDLRVIVVDNASQDGTVAALADYPDVTTIEAPGNLGYAGGINIAYTHVRPGEHILILNPDLTLQPNAVRILLERLHRCDAAVVVPLIQNGNGLLFYSLRREPTLVNALGDAVFGSYVTSRLGSLSDIEWNPDHYTFAHPVEWASGAAMLLNSDLRDEVGQWDERYFLYMEETDFLRRVRQTGKEIWFDPAARVTHTQGGSGSSSQLDALLAVNRVRYMERYHSLLYASAYRTIIALHHLARANQPSSRAALAAVVDRTRWAGLPKAQLTASALSHPGSILIPAHNEEAVIGRTLAGLGTIPTNWEVIVICNASTDATADIARSFEGVAVLETAVASKSNALNLGDSVATSWPRLYLDADIDITPDAVNQVFAALSSGEEVEAARPSALYDTRGASWVVRAYYNVRQRIPEFKEALWGAGAYALSAVGHERFDEFPAVTADDLFVDQTFPAGTKRIVTTSSVVVRTPRDVRSLLKVLRRGIRAKTEVSGDDSTGQTARSLLATIRGPISAAEAFIYASIVALARLQARTLRAKSVRWERDASSR